ncbi:hypothetical protein C4577_05605 [Candidatus Parcubacteria bacterium]|nr:MAG: hypothetical protein C4577_05605 [Candidatus Parcubacteria bacterium]
MKDVFSKSITITLIYDSAVQKITNTPSEPSIVNEGMPFIMLLYFVFQSYPEIQEKYPPGTLGLLLNGKPPTDFDILQDGDKVELRASGFLMPN